MDVSALEAGIITLPMVLYIKGAPQTEVAVCPSIAFVLVTQKIFPPPSKG